MLNPIKKVQNHAFRQHLWKKGDKIIVAVSGGPDSVFLLSFFGKIAPKYNLSIHVAHVNYQLRGGDSDKDEQLVRRMAEKMGFSVSVYIPKKSASFSEASLRQIRYSLFESLRKRIKYDMISVAHTMDDQAETVLMNIIRGAGLQGLSGMRAKNGKIIRPLLETSRSEVMAYLKMNKIKSRLDKSNLDLKFFRNKVRRQLLPCLEKEYNPEIRKRLAALAETVAQEYAYLIDQVDERFKCRKINSGQIVFNIKELLSLPEGLRRLALRKVVGELKLSLANIEKGHIQEIEKVIASSKSKAQEIVFGGLKLKRNGDKITLTKA